MHQLRYIDDPMCACGDAPQTADHLLECPAMPACMPRGHPGSQRNDSDMAPSAK